MSHTGCGQPHTDATLALVAAGQHGAFHRRQAVAAGFSSRMIEWRVHVGLWIPVHRSVYRLAGAPRSWQQSLMAACLAAGAQAVASHRSAGALWRLEGLEYGPLEVTIPAARRRPGVAGATIYRARSLRPSSCASVDAVPVTRAARTLIDLAGVLDQLALETALDSALRLRLVTVPHLARSLESLGSPGRKGAGTLRSLLTDRASARPAESGRELRLARLLVAVGLPQPIRQYEVREHGRVLARFDLAYPDCRIAVEFESYRHHFGRQAWYRDQGRNNRVAALDWLVFPMTESDLRDPTRAAALEAAEAHRRRSGRYGGGVCR